MGNHQQPNHLLKLPIFQDRLRHSFVNLIMKKLRGNRLYRTHIRKKLANRYYASSKDLIRQWSKKNTETSNFYYNLTEANSEDLISLLSLLLGIEKKQLRRYRQELDEDFTLREHIRGFFASHKETSDSVVGYGRRYGWYLAVRALKPKTVVETGVSHGVGACLISSALMRNLSEGFPGRYIGIDIDPSSGNLFSGIYAGLGQIIYGDSAETISNLKTRIDIFINDSDHSELYEAREYELIIDLLSEKSLILGDNSHVTSCLRDFAEREKRPYVFFKEQPKSHWYPGAGIGISPTKVPLL